MNKDKFCLSGGVQIDLGNGEIVGWSGDSSPVIYTDGAGNYSATKESGWTVADWSISSDNNWLDSLGTTANKVLNLFNNVADTYTKVTGSNIVAQDKSSQAGNIDENTVNQIMNSVLNQVRTYGKYIAIGIGAIVLTTIISNKKTRQSLGIGK